MEKLPAGRPQGHAGLLGPFGNGLLGFVAGALLDVLDGATGGIFNLDALADRMRGTEQAAENAQNTADAVAASASNLAEIYNFDVAANRTKFPAVAPFSYITAGYAYSGSHVALLQPAPGYPGNAALPVGQKFRVTPGEKIYLEWRQRRSGADFEARLNIVILDSLDGVIAAEPPVMAGTPPVVIQPSTTATDNVWGLYKGVVEIPVNAYNARAELKLQLAAGGTPVGSWAFDNVIVRRAVEADLSGIEAALAGKADYTDIPTNVPLWQSVVPTDDPTYPDALNVFQTSVNSSGNESETRVPAFTTTSGEMDIGFIRALRDRDYQQVGFQIGRGGIIGSGPFELYVCVYRVNQANGNMTKIWDSGNIKALVHSVGSGNQVRLNLPQFSASQGEVLAVGMVQRASITAPSYQLYGLDKPWSTPPAGYWPRGLYAVAATGTTWPPPASISGSSLVWDDDRVPWFFLG